MNEEIRILLLEDMASDAEFVKRVLTRTNYSLVYERVSTREDFMRALEQFKPDIILADHTMPQFDSMSALQIIREQYPGIPFVLVTGTVSEEFAVQAIKQGADDYILKKSLTRLPAALEAALDKKRTARALKESEKKFQATLNLLNDMKFALDQANIVSISDMQGRITYVNEKFCQITGYRAEEVLGQPYFVIDSKHHSREFFVELWSKVQHGEVWRGEIKDRARDGREFWCDTTVVPCLDENKTPYQFVTIKQDITTRKNHEENLQRINRELQQVNEELDRFVYSASHDLKAPLIGVSGLLEELKREIINPEHLEYLELAGQSLANLQEVIVSLTNFSRNSRTPVEAEKIDFKELAEKSIRTLRYLDRENNIRFQVHIEQPVIFRSDPARLSMLFNNLLSNAILYHNLNQSEPLIEVLVKVTAQKAQIMIRDNGQGIEEKKQHRVFDMFFRGSEQSIGSGLGLYIVKGIVEKLQGHIELQSEYGKGTTFTIELANFNQTLLQS